MKNIFIHGLGQKPSSWDKVVATMGSHSDVFCPDLTKFLCGKEADYTNLYQAFSEYCTELEGPLNLCGLSLGGILALQYVIENPQKVNSIVLIGTQYVMPKGLLKFQNMIFHIMPKKVFRETGFGKKEFISLSKSMMDLDFREALNEIQCPVLIVCGEKDSANKRASIEMRKIIPFSRLVLFKDVGHEVNIDAPEKLGEVIRRFEKASSKT